MAGQPATSALNYLRAANGHLQAAKILEPHIGQIGNYTESVFVAFYNVLGFAVELYLKAYLANSGLDSDVLSSRPYGHNLQSLYEEARARGLTLQESALRRIVSLLNPNHSEYTYRYLTDNCEITYIVPGESMRLTFQALDELHNLITLQIPRGTSPEQP